MLPVYQQIAETDAANRAFRTVSREDGQVGSGSRVGNVLECDVLDALPRCLAVFLVECRA